MSGTIYRIINKIYLKMLLQLCQKCSAECTHCMVSATKNGKVMNLETLNNAIKYINLVNPKH